MSRKRGRTLLAALWASVALCTASTGCFCHTKQQLFVDPCAGQMPRELNKVSHPTYVIEPPDILLIDAVRIVPLPPYRIEPLDGIIVQVDPTPMEEPINGIYIVQPEGTVDLGFSYGTVSVIDLTLEEAKKAVEAHLKKAGTLKDPRVTVALGQSRGRQQIRGEHLVRQDGTVSLGIYGPVHVAGMTLAQAKAAIEEQLAQYLLRPEVTVDVAAFNSKVYYIITDGAGFGKVMYRFPIVGNETVMDALGQINGTPAVAAYNKMWIARPAPDNNCTEQVLPIDLVAITEKASTATNYQIFPGDRIYVKADSLLTLDGMLAKINQPLERIFGVTLLGSAALKSIGWASFGQNGAGGGGGINRGF